MEEIVPAALVLAVGFALRTAVLRFHEPSEAKLLGWSFVAHIASVFGQITLVKYYYGYGDLLTYHTVAMPLADALRYQFVDIAPELLTVLFQGETHKLPVDVYGGGSTSTMIAVTAFLLYLTADSLYATSLLIGLGSYLGKVMIYWALRPEFPRAQHQAILAAATLVPSVVFWSSAILKEALVVGCLGPMLLGLRYLLERRRTASSIGMILSSGLAMSLLKPYVLMALSGAGAIFYARHRLKARGSYAMKPVYVAVGIILGVVGYYGAARYFNRFSEGSIGATMASQRRVGYTIEGGSNFYLESADVGRESRDRTLVEELALAPLGLATALFRPVLFEVRSPIQFLNAIEMTAVLGLAFLALRRNGVRGLVGRIWQSPTLTFCAVFTLTLALGTGLASSNLGSLSRYRAPMMPFYAMLLLVLRSSPQALLVEAGPLGRARPRQLAAALTKAPP